MSGFLFSGGHKSQRKNIVCWGIRDSGLSVPLFLPGCVQLIATEDGFYVMWTLWFYERMLFTAFIKRASLCEAEQSLAPGACQ